MTDTPLPPRHGAAPAVDGTGHEQITQPSPFGIQVELINRVSTLPGVVITHSYTCVAGSRAAHLSSLFAHGPATAFITGTEFGHVHPSYDGSLHLMLPDPVAVAVFAAGWGVRPEPAEPVLVYGPRTAEELSVVWLLTRASYLYACEGPVDLDVVEREFGRRETLPWPRNEVC
jgi:Family of unknown function (DUF5519)